MLQHKKKGEAARVKSANNASFFIPGPSGLLCLEHVSHLLEWNKQR